MILPRIYCPDNVAHRRRRLARSGGDALERFGRIFICPSSRLSPLRAARLSAGDPLTLQLLLTSDGFGAVQFGYRSATWAAGGGVFDFALRDANANLFYVSTAYDVEGAGHAGVVIQAADGGTGWFEQCWGANACLVYVNDPANLTCQLVPPETSCDYGVATDCPVVPVSPF